MDGDAGWTLACIDARMRSLLFLLVCLPLAVQTRPFFVGLTGGIPFGRITSSVPFGPDESRRYTFGVTLGAALNEHISVEFIVHELLHFSVPKHGKRWKSLMRAHLGDYERLEGRLRRAARPSAGRTDSPKRKRASHRFDSHA